jgi:lysophospholipase L1-like esterase
MLKYWKFAAALIVAALLIAQPNAAPVRAAAAWNYTALGDSLAFGLWALRGYVPRYRTYITTDTGANVTLNNLGVNARSSSGLLDALQNDAATRTLVASSQVITWDIGGEDFLQARDSYRAKTCGGVDNQDCLRAAVATFKSNYAAIVQAILARRGSNPTIYRTMDLYNPYVSTDKHTDTWHNDAGSDFQVFKPYLDEVNQFIASTATANHIPYAKVYRKFNGACGCQDPRGKGYIAADGLHPNDKGHKAIADLFRALKYQPLH